MSIHLNLANEAATRRFAEALSLALRPGDLITLSGDLGAGKSFLVRALLRAAADDPELEVPSPTFTLVQSYENLPFGTAAHMDLYRLSDPRELDELGLDDALATGVVLMEWPDKGAVASDQASLALSLVAHNDNSRDCVIDGKPDVLTRVSRSLAIRDYLNDHGHEKSIRRFLTGDASTRAYETVHPVDGPSVILMNAPTQPDGPAIKDGKPYSQIAHLAEDMRAFYGVQKILSQAGFHTPAIDSADLDQGLLIIENLGSGSVLDREGKPMADRYEAAVDMLAALHRKPIASSAQLPNGTTHEVPSYSAQALAIEVDLLPQWYAPYRLGMSLDSDAYDRFTKIWAELIEKLHTAENSLVLRDFHSPNIIWCDDKKGTDRIGLIDFQDAVIGPTAYDVASLALDARVTIGADLEAKLVKRYCAARANESGFDEENFRQAYAIMGAQRVTKILGIFVRLWKRDGKQAYLAHLPRMEDYLARTLSHPTLADLKKWVSEELSKKANA